MYIPSPINQIHILDYYCNHYTLKVVNQATIEIQTNSEFKSHSIGHPQFIEGI